MFKFATVTTALKRSQSMITEFEGNVSV